MDNEIADETNAPSMQLKTSHWRFLVPAGLFLMFGFANIIFSGSAFLPPYSSIGIFFVFTGFVFLFQYFEWILAARILSGIFLIFSCLILVQGQTSGLIFSSFENPNAISSICFVLINLALVVSTNRRHLQRSNAAVVALGTLIFVIAAIAFIGNVYGIDRTAGLFLMDHLLSVAFMIAGICLMVPSWNSLQADTDKSEMPWYMIPRNISILTAAITYVLLVVAYPSFHNDPSIRPEELLTIILLGSIVYYLRHAHQRSKELEQTIIQLNSARDSLINQEKLASLGVLVTGIAHEIKNPLNFIYNFSELTTSMIADIKKTFESHKTIFSAEECSELDENFKDIEKNLESINKQSARANNTVHRMLLHARSKADGLVSTDLNSLLDEYLTLSYQGLRASEPGFTIKIEKTYASPNSFVNVDAEGIGRVVLNILNNAYYALVDKKKKSDSTYVPTLSIITEMHQDHFEIRIKDNGNGISGETEKNIFTPFFTTKPSGVGTGLGLSLSRNIIEKEHNGSLTFQSQEGSFTEFIIKLPVTINNA